MLLLGFISPFSIWLKASPTSKKQFMGQRSTLLTPQKINLKHHVVTPLKFTTASISLKKSWTIFMNSTKRPAFGNIKKQSMTFYHMP
jgi:hypothetical protein